MENARRKKVILAIVAIIIVALTLILSLIEYITDFLWFKEMGYTDVFFKKLVTQVVVGAPVFVIVAALVLVYLNHLRRSYFRTIESKEIPNMKRLKGITVALAAVASIIATVATVRELWFDILEYTNSTDFNILDPIFNLDISFYVFKLEFLSQLNEIVIGVIIGLAILTILYYGILLTVRTPDVVENTPNGHYTDDGEYHENYNGGSGFSGLRDAFEGGRFDPSKIRFGGGEKKQLNKENMKGLFDIASGKIALLGFVFFIMLGINFMLDSLSLLHAHTGVVYGAGFTDSVVTLNMYRALMILSALAAVLFVINIRRKKYIRVFIAPALMILVLVIGGVASGLVQNYIVSPDEIAKESKYLARNIEYTQYAYGLDDVEVRDFAADDKLTAADITANLDTINNIRINDFSPTGRYYMQTQAIRQYYTFNDVDVDRYMINDEYTQVFLAAREIDDTKISDTWLNQHLIYTHGYGAALSRVDSVTASGQPSVIIGNIPPESSAKEIQITRPEIYFGELTDSYIIVGTDQDEFDYPNGEGNAYSHYNGTAGIKLSLFNRILYAIREGNMKILVSSNINSESKIIYRRNIVDRITTIMPDLIYDDDPYLVIADGRLFWIVDGYTYSTYYPYSEPYNERLGINYIRNSVKVVVDAYNGDTNFYIADASDPIAITYSKIYPTLFKPLSEMPESLTCHLRYPDSLLEIQSNVYTKYHMNDVNIFYQQEDIWDIANEIYDKTPQQLSFCYFIAKLPGEEKAEFFNSIPFTPKSKKNMTALMVAKSDDANYGKLVLYQFPKSKTIYGPEQIEAQIDQNTEISKEFSLWNSTGSTYKRGNMFVIPIETSILYVEPIYLEATSSSIPEVKRIVAFYDDRIAYKETLAECLVELFGPEAAKGVNGSGVDIDDPITPQPPENPEQPPQGGDTQDKTMSELISLANEAFANAEKAQKNGDWANYGKYLDQLEKYLTELSKLQ